jgi:hypothetical protein
MLNYQKVIHQKLSSWPLWPYRDAGDLVIRNTIRESKVHLYGKRMQSRRKGTRFLHSNTNIALRQIEGLFKVAVEFLTGNVHSLIMSSVTCYV